MKESILLFVGGLGSMEFILVVFFAVVPVFLWVWAILDLLNRNFPDNTNKIIWALVIIFIPVLGALLYLFLGRTQKYSS